MAEYRYDESTKDAILEVLASAAGLTTEGATLDVDAGSVILTATFPVQSASDVNAASSSISSALSDRTGASLPSCWGLATASVGRC